MSLKHTDLADITCQLPIAAPLSHYLVAYSLVVMYEKLIGLDVVGI